MSTKAKNQQSISSSINQQLYERMAISEKKGKTTRKQEIEDDSERKRRYLLEGLDEEKERQFHKHSACVVVLLLLLLLLVFCAEKKGRNFKFRRTGVSQGFVRFRVVLFLVDYFRSVLRFSLRTKFEKCW